MPESSEGRKVESNRDSSTRYGTGPCTAAQFLEYEIGGFLERKGRKARHDTKNCARSKGGWREVIPGRLSSSELSESAADLGESEAEAEGLGTGRCGDGFTERWLLAGCFHCGWGWARTPRPSRRVGMLAAVGYRRVLLPSRSPDP
jgi:hypothetical protein